MTGTRPPSTRFIPDYSQKLVVTRFIGSNVFRALRPHECGHYKRSVNNPVESSLPNRVGLPPGGHPGPSCAHRHGPFRWERCIGNGKRGETESGNGVCLRFGRLDNFHGCLFTQNGGRLRSHEADYFSAQALPVPADARRLSETVTSYGLRPRWPGSGSVCLVPPGRGVSIYTGADSN